MSAVRGAMKTPEAEDRHIESGRKHLGANESVYELEVPARTLSEVLDRHRVGHVDLLSLDVEGYEADVLRGIDFARHRPDFILVEARFPDDIQDVLGSWYQRVACLTEYSSHTDILYAAK